jgi:hypothetical protein
VVIGGATGFVAPATSATPGSADLVGAVAGFAVTTAGGDVWAGTACDRGSAAGGASATVATGAAGVWCGGHAIHIAKVPVAAAIGKRTAHRFHTGVAGAAGGSARANAASTAWQREHSARCASTRVASSGPSEASAHDAMALASRQAADAACGWVD